MQAYILAALKQPDACIHDLPLLAASDRNAIVMGFNATSAQFPSGYCVHDLFENQADENPGALCLALAEGQVTYGEVETLANRLATHLVELGLGPGVPVGLMMPRCAEMYIAMLAILKVGPWTAAAELILVHLPGTCQHIAGGSQNADIHRPSSHTAETLTCS